MVFHLVSFVTVHDSANIPCPLIYDIIPKSKCLSAIERTHLKTRCPSMNSKVPLYSNELKWLDLKDMLLI